MLILKRLVEVTEEVFEGKMRGNREKSGVYIVLRKSERS